MRPILSIASTSRAISRSHLSTTSSTPLLRTAVSLLQCTCAHPVATPLRSSLRSLSTRASSSVLASLPKASPSLLAKRTALDGAKVPSLARFASFLSRKSATSGKKSLSTAALVHPDPPEVPLTTPDVAKYLLVIAGMVFTIVVVGGLTRLTESGLSITEWNVVSGILPPLGAEDWEREFTKYRDTPEWRIQNQHITLSEFKTIFFWEWSHRILGRVIGLSFLAPIPYFFLRRRLSPRSSLALLGIGTLIGCQGGMGWYMVKSGLDEAKVKELGGVPRVSQYRLAAHLGLAFLVYSACVRLSLGVGRDWKIINGGAASAGTGLGGFKSVSETLSKLNAATVGRTRVLVTALTALIWFTAISGAFVAGLDAGLVYNDFPTMGGRLVPPTNELFSDFYSRSPDKSDRIWRNMLENPTTVQFDHRVLAMTTFTAIVALFLFTRRPVIAATLPPMTLKLIQGTFAMSLVQVSLGISTLIYLVPIPLAAAHQAGSLVLLTLALATGASLRRPGRVATELLKLRKMKLASGMGKSVKVPLQA